MRFKEKKEIGLMTRLPRLQPCAGGAGFRVVKSHDTYALRTKAIPERKRSHAIILPPTFMIYRRWYKELR